MEKLQVNLVNYKIKIISFDCFGLYQYFFNDNNGKSNYFYFDDVYKPFMMMHVYYSFYVYKKDKYK